MHIDHDLTRQLLIEIDDNGQGLDKDEINFVADLIDGDTTEFSEQQARKIARLHAKRVENSEEDDE